jgi:hypothetical protein
MEAAMKENRSYEVGLFKREDAEGIVGLFKEIYGDEYPIKLFYDREELTKANEEGRYYSIVARTPDGRIVGVNHLYRSAPNEKLYEWGVGLVSRDWRGEGVFNRIGTVVTEDVIPRLGIQAVFGESVCNHLHSQKMCARARFIDMALEAALMPGEVYSREASTAARVAALLQFRTYKPRPHKIFVPACYEKELRFLYSGFDDERELVTTNGDGLPSDKTETDLILFDFAKVARVSVFHAGADFEERMEELEKEWTDKSSVVIEVWLKATEPGACAAVEILREKGYFFGGVLPRWFDDDGIFMEKLDCPPCFDSIQLYSDRAGEILAMVKKDWERASRTGGDR